MAKPERKKGPSKAVLAAQNAALAAVLHGLVVTLVREREREERDALMGAMRAKIDTELRRFDLDDTQRGIAQKIISDVLYL